MTARIVTAALLASLLGASPAAAAWMNTEQRHATFRISVRGVQTTQWVEDHQATPNQPCDYTETGNGSERVVFSSRPVKVTAWHMGTGPVMFVRARKPATLPGRGKVTRHGTLKLDFDPSCAVGDGGDGGSAPPASDCGTKRITSLPLELVYRGKRITVTNHGQGGPDFSYCPLQGEGWTTILDDDNQRETAGQELPLDDLFDRKQGKILVLGDGTVNRSSSNGISYRTHVEWTLTLRRLRG